MLRSSLTSAHRLKDGPPKLTWKELTGELSRHYSSIPFDSHATQAFAHLQQGPSELPEIYLHCASELI